MRDWPENPRSTHKRAVFLDRDGTINRDTHYPHRVDELQFIPGALEAICALSELPVHIIVVANQAGIALGIFTQEEMSAFNAELRRRIEAVGGRIDAFYFCPDREPKDLALGERPSQCSKPEPGMLLEAARDFNLDLKKSILVGDKTSDIAAGKRVGCFSILVRTGKAGQEEGAMDVTPDRVCDDLSEAPALISDRLCSEGERLDIR